VRPARLPSLATRGHASPRAQCHERAKCCWRSSRTAKRLRWAEELAPYADAARPQALVQHTDITAVGEAAGLNNVDILSAARRAATSALSIEGRAHSSQGPARIVIATEGQDAAELVLAIAGQTGAGEHAQVHVVGPTTRGFEQRCGEAIKTVSVTVHSCELDQIAGRVPELEAEGDERWTIADPIYVWMHAHVTALAVTRALCEVTRNRICVLTADGDVLVAPSDRRRHCRAPRAG